MEDVHKSLTFGGKGLLSGESFFMIGGLYAADGLFECEVARHRQVAERSVVDEPFDLDCVVCSLLTAF